MSQRIARITGHISGAAAPTASLSTQDCAYFDTMKVAPPNAIFHTKTAYKNDPDSRKVSP